jgi:DNA-binding transcriptional LysR family regulator
MQLCDIAFDITETVMDKLERIQRRLKLQDVRVLLSVVQAGSMHKAAERLGTSQPAVSRSIADLEHALGVRLLDRSRRGIEPTQYGRAIAKRGIAVFDELRQGVKDIEFLADPTAGDLRVGCTETVAAGPGLVVMDRLTRRHPRIMFDVVTGGWIALHRNLMERNVELVMAGIISPVSEEFVVETLFDDPLVVAAGLQNPWTRRRQIKLTELVNEPWTLPPSDGPAGTLAVEAFRASGLEPPRTMITTVSLNLRIQLLATGRFLTMLPASTLMPHGKYRLLKALPVEPLNVRRTVVIVTLRNRTLSPLAELFIETARALAKQLARAR